MPELRNRTWRITTAPVIPPDGGAPQALVRTIEAAYVTSDDAQPGWTILKDREHKAVYQVRADLCLDIERIDTTTD